MPFRIDEDCSRKVCANIGLYQPNSREPRDGDAVRVGERGDDIVTCVTHKSPIPQPLAQILYNRLPDAMKNTPADINEAIAVAHLAWHADVALPNPCRDLIRHAGQTLPVGVTYYCSPGSPIINGKNEACRFISFIHKNTVRRYRTQWCDMTGSEQFEWYKAWVDAGKTHDRLINQTGVLGLRGTDISLITSQAQLTSALERSPSVARRRPVTHRLSAAVWGTTCRQLDIDFSEDEEMSDDSE